jgi:hypothetical protein
MHVRSSYFILFIWIWYPVDCNWRCRHISKSIITCISNFEALYFFILQQKFFISRIVKCPGSVVVAVCSSLMSMQILSNSPPNSHVQNHFTQRFLTLRSYYVDALWLLSSVWRQNGIVQSVKFLFFYDSTSFFI